MITFGLSAFVKIVCLNEHPQKTEWRRMSPGEIIEYESVTYESPSGLFRVNFTADMGIRLGGVGTAVHIWNTAKPSLDARLVRGTLSLFKQPYAIETRRPDDLALLSLRDGRLYQLGETAEYLRLGTGVVTLLEGAIREIRRDIGLPPAERDDRPGAPPPSP